MALRSIALTLVAALGLAACATPDTSSRNVTLDSPLLGGPAAVTRDYALAEMRVFVPETLQVSESASFYPITDIVWRGDPYGDRRAQIANLFETAAARVAPDLAGAVPVIAVVQLERFHGVTERTRFTIGGVYNVVFSLTVIDANTGQIIEASRQITADLPAPGGAAALALDASGQTERVRVLDFLTYVLRRELGPRVAPGAPEALAL